MNELVRCRACGFVTSKTRLGEICPACSVPKTAFDPYNDRVSAGRRRIIRLHLHPVAAHLPQVLPVLLFALILGARVAPENWARDFKSTIKIMSLMMPIVGIAAFATGIIDAKARLKSVKHPYLKYKIIAGLFYILVSSAMAGLIFHYGMKNMPMWSHYSHGVCFISAIVLGRLGSALNCTELPG